MTANRVGNTSEEGVNVGGQERICLRSRVYCGFFVLMRAQRPHPLTGEVRSREEPAPRVREGRSPALFEFLEEVRVSEDNLQCNRVKGIGSHVQEFTAEAGQSYMLGSSHTIAVQ